MEKEDLKLYLEQFLKNHGTVFDGSGKFLCPWHDDGEPSMSIEPHGKNAHCFVCETNADIFRFGAHFYGLDEKRDFREIKRRVESELGRAAPEAPAKSRTETPPDPPVTLSYEEALAVYTPKAVTDLGKFIFGDAMAPGAELRIEKVFPCKNEAGDVEFVEARFHPSCFRDGRKRTCAIWWNGKRIKSKNNPHGLFGRELLAAAADRPVLVVEGPKCQEAAKVLSAFVPVAWNGGAHGQKKIDFSPLAGRRVYIWPDDDEAGGKSARATAKLLQGIAADIIIVNPLPEARMVKSEKADIVEALQVKTADQITEYILNHTPPEEGPKSSDPYIHAGLFLAGEGFFKIYDRKATAFYSEPEDQVYGYAEIRDKYAEEKIDGINPAKMAKMINNLEPVYPVYHLVKSFGYIPRYMGRDGAENRYVINRWKGFRFPVRDPASNPEAEKEAEFVRGHIRDIICGGNEDDYNYLCKWIAHLFKNPGTKPGVAVFAHSEVQGTGKSLVFEQLVPNMLGIDITRVFSNEEQISEKFNAWLFENLYVVFSEQSFYSNTENIKSWITDPNQSRRDMGTESRQERSYARFVICTNKENSFRFEESERRMFVLNVSNRMALAAPEEKWAYFNRLGAAVNNAAVLDAMARFFVNIDISGFNPFDIPESDKKREIIEAEKHPVIDFFESVIYGEDQKCQILPCSEIDPESDENYHKCPSLYEGIRAVCVKGEYFIERKRLFDAWHNGLGRNRREGMNRFTRIIKNYYPESRLEIVDRVINEKGKTRRTPIIIIKQPMFAKK